MDDIRKDFLSQVVFRKHLSKNSFLWKAVLMEVKFIIITLLVRDFHFIKMSASVFGLLCCHDLSVCLIAGALNSNSRRREVKLFREMCDSGRQKSPLEGR